jgi:hypothetical protein
VRAESLQTKDCSGVSRAAGRYFTLTFIGDWSENVSDL